MNELRQPASRIHKAVCFVILALHAFLFLPLAPLRAESLQAEGHPLVQPSMVLISSVQIPSHLFPIEGQKFVFNEQGIFPENRERPFKEKIRSERTRYEHWWAGAVILTIVIAAVVIASDRENNDNQSGRSLR